MAAAIETPGASRPFASAQDNSRFHSYESGGGVTVLADRFEGKCFNIPNDVVVDPAGRVWFTDPYYEGAAGPWSYDRAHKELDHDSVYRLDPQPDGYTHSTLPTPATCAGGAPWPNSIPLAECQPAGL